MKINLGFYPYTYARVSAMKAKLIKAEEYHKLLKMRLNEITKFLEDLEYKSEIDQLSAHHSKEDLLERALNANLSKAFDKLRRISEPELVLLIDAYMKRFDIENIKTILRGKFANEKEEKIKSLMVPLGSLDKRFINELASLNSVEEVIKRLKIEQLENAYEKFKETRNLFWLENALDQYYYSGLAEFLKTVPKEGELFVKFLKNEIDALNIKTLLRLKREKFDRKEIMNYLFFSGNKLNPNKLNKLAGMSMDEIISELENIGYAKIMKEAIDNFEKEHTLIDIEFALNEHLLKGSILLLHQNPLSIDVILGYMFAKEIEIKNLKTIIKGKQLGLDERFIEHSLIVEV